MKVSGVFKKVFPEIKDYDSTPLLNVFISECNLACLNCPVEEQLSAGGKKIMLNTLLEEIGKKFDEESALPDAVVISGGEPMMFFETSILCSALISLGKTVYVKTNGTGELKNLPPEVIKIVNFKLVSSGEAGEFFFENLSALSEKDALLFKIYTKEDLDLAFTLLNNLELNMVKFGFIFRLMDTAVSQDDVENLLKAKIDENYRLWYKILVG